MNSNIFDQLNPQQKEAVKNVKGPAIVLAGAGSGKTRVLTQKVLHLIEDYKVDPSHIAMMTFTNKAAREMQARVPYTLGFIGTFHSLCARILRHDIQHLGMSNDFVIYDEDDAQSLLKSIIKDVPLRKKLTPRMAKYRISSAKDNMLSPEKFARLATDDMDEAMGLIYIKYQKRLTQNNALDFDDLIFKTVELFKKNERVLGKYQDMFQYILIDEFQDTNPSQYTLAQQLAKKHKNITVVGDFSQSIYSWRGADIRNLEYFQNDFENAHVVHLEQNYRSTQKVLEFAYEVINHNDSHPILELFTENPEGEDIKIQQTTSEQDEALYIAEEVEKLQREGYAHNQMAILYRMNAQSRVIEEAFLHYGIPYILIGGTRFYERKEIKDILAYLRLIINPDDEVSHSRAVKLGKRRFALFAELREQLNKSDDEISTDILIEKIFEATEYLSMYDKDDPQDAPRLENLKELKSVALRFDNLVEFLHQVALVESEYSENERKQNSKDGVRLMTLHQAKGLEFPIVFIVGAEEGILPHSRALYDRQELEEERRLMYVGITRAEKKLYITYAQRRFMFGRRMSAQPSRFIEGYLDESQYIKTF